MPKPIMAVSVSVGPFAFVLPFSPGIFWIPFWREKVSSRRNFVSKMNDPLRLFSGNEPLMLDHTDGWETLS